MCGELADGSWVKLQNYGMRDSLEEVIPAIPRLLAAWETLNRDNAPQPDPLADHPQLFPT